MKHHPYQDDFKPEVIKESLEFPTSFTRTHEFKTIFIILWTLLTQFHFPEFQSRTVNRCQEADDPPPDMSSEGQ